MSSSFESDDPPCKRHKEIVDFEEEDRRDSIPHPVVPLSIRDIRLDLNLIPDTVILETMKLVSNQDRRELSFTCRRFRNMIIKNKTPEMDRRKIIDWMEVYFTHCSPFFHVYSHSHNVSKSFKDFAAFEDYVKQLGSFYVSQQVDLSEFESLPNGTVDLWQLVKVVCGITHEISGLFSHTTVEVFKQWIDVFFECPQMKEIRVSPDEYKYPDGVWDEYCTTVTEKGQSKGIEVRRGEENGYWTCKKLTMTNGKEIIEICGDRDYEDLGDQC